MSLFVKVCGIASQSDAEQVAAEGPDAMGFVLWEGSPRGVKPEDVGQWETQGANPIKRVGVVVDGSWEDLLEWVEQARLDVLQLHGPFGALPDNWPGIPVWRVVYLEKDPSRDWNFLSADAYLMDRKTKQMPGGTGLTLDWELAKEFVSAQPTPSLLAGGIRPDNVVEACRAVSPWGVDASSHLEREPGRKDLNKVREYIQLCREL